MNPITQFIQSIENALQVSGVLRVSTPPNASMGDIAISCFLLAKEKNISAPQAAILLESEIKNNAHEAAVDTVAVVGPYVNITFTDTWMVKQFIQHIGTYTAQKKVEQPQTVLVEFACPNPMKAFHLGHLRNTVTGESVARMLEAIGQKVTRVNYQGDVGMHIAKSLWGIYQDIDAFHALQERPIKERVEFLGRAYANGANAYETDEQAKENILIYNQYVYEKHPSIEQVYKTARSWSLEYFDTIYQTLDTHFDRFYFESDVSEKAVELIEQGVQQNVFVHSNGAVIYKGSNHGLHDRVFKNSKGFPTYEGKELGLAYYHVQEYHPDKIIHVVGKEQSDYFAVVFHAIADMIPETTGKEFHLVGGYLQLKGDVKMSSRKGNVITGDALLSAVQEQVHHIMVHSDIKNKEEVAATIATAALKYTLLKVGVSEDVAFDMKESVSLSGDSGPYLLYIVARINSILKKQPVLTQTASSSDAKLHNSEKALVQILFGYTECVMNATNQLDPSQIARYIFSLAKSFNTFYHDCPILTATETEYALRVQLIQEVKHVMTHGLSLLGIQTVEEM